jgi:ribosome-binding factor A
VAQHRRDRVAHLIRAELAALLLREARDPRLQAVTITDVRVTADLRLAHVHFRTLTPEAAPREAQAALRRATPFLRGALGRALGMRVTPELRFAYDTTPDTARRVDALLDKVRPGAPAENDEDES